MNRKRVLQQAKDGRCARVEIVDLSGLGKDGVYRSASRSNLYRNVMVKLAGKSKGVSAGGQVELHWRTSPSRVEIVNHQAVQEGSNNMGRESNRRKISTVEGG